MSLLYARLVAWLVKWGALLALLLAVCGALFVGGCNHGTGKQAERDAKAMAQADARANGYAAQVSVLTQTIAVIDAGTANALALAAEQAKRASVATERANEYAKDYAKAVEQAERDLAQAARDPDCGEVLRKPVCARLQ